MNSRHHLPVLLPVLLALFACAAEAQLPVGAVLPLSGDAAFIGQAMREGMELGLKARPNCNLSLVFEDDKTADSLAAVSAVHKLIDSDKVQLLLNSVVNTSRAIAPIVEAAGIPTLIVWDSNETIANLGPHIFGLGISTEAGGRMLAEYAAGSLKAKTAAIISLEDEWSEIIAAAFRKEFVKRGGVLVLDKAYSPSTTDFRDAVAALRTRAPDVIYFPLFGTTRAVFLKQYRLARGKAQLLTSDLFPEELRDLTGMLKGVRSSQPYLTDRMLADLYRNHFGKEEPQGSLGFVALGYDAVSLICAVKSEIEAANRPLNALSLQAALSSFRFSGLVTRVDFRRGRLSGAEPALTIVEGGLRLLDKNTASTRSLVDDTPQFRE